MSSPTCSCTESDLLLAYHRALPPSAWLRVQLHRLTCPLCQERYRKLSHVSRQLAGAMSPHPIAASPRSVRPLWGAVLLCTLALSAAAWSAQAYFGVVTTAAPACEIASPVPPLASPCKTPK